MTGILDVRISASGRLILIATGTMKSRHTFAVGSRLEMQPMGSSISNGSDDLSTFQNG